MNEADRLFCADYEPDFTVITVASAEQFKRLDFTIALRERADAVLRNDAADECAVLQQCAHCEWITDGPSFGHAPGCPGEM